MRELEVMAAFLLARIAEAEAVARKAAEDHYYVEGGLRYDEVGYETSPHLTVDPALVRAECEAKRQIVQLLLAKPYDCGQAHPTMGIYHPDGHAAQDPILRSFLSVHADHPDFRAEWSS